MSDSLIANYLHERRGLKTIFEENAFVCYKITDTECFIAELCVSFTEREKGVCRKLLAKLAEIAMAEGCRDMTGNIHLSAPGSGTTLRAALAIGFEVIRADNQILLISKSLAGV